MGTKNQPGEFDCYDAAADDEPMFVLLARDVCAPEAVEAWAHARVDAGKNRISDRQIVEAVECAEAMRAYRRGNAESVRGGGDD